MTLEYRSVYRLKKARRESVLNRQRRNALLALLIVGLAMWIVSRGAFGMSAEPSYVEGIYVSVQRGDSLWSIADKHRPDNRDIRKFMSTIAAYNDMDSLAVYEGQTLFIPSK